MALNCGELPKQEFELNHRWWRPEAEFTNFRGGRLLRMRHVVRETDSEKVIAWYEVSDAGYLRQFFEPGTPYLQIAANNPDNPGKLIDAVLEIHHASGRIVTEEPMLLDS